MEQLGDRIGVNKSTIWRWEKDPSEKDARAPHFADIDKLAKALDIEPVALMFFPADADHAKRIIRAIDRLDTLRPDVADEWLHFSRLLRDREEK